MKFYIFIWYCAPLLIYASRDLYDVLKVSKDASFQEIKHSYRKLAKIWHPDKNDAEDAEQKFLEIGEAYKILSDPETRRIYDETGQLNFDAHQHFSAYRHFQNLRNMFENKDGSYSFYFKNDGLAEVFAKHAITYNVYMDLLLKHSRTQPFLIFFYSDWCIPCFHLKNTWQKLVDELGPINFGMSTVNVGKEERLAKDLEVTVPPDLIMLLDGHPYHYADAPISISSSLEFIRSKFPDTLVRRIDPWNIFSFLHGWKDNKVRVLVFGHEEFIRLRYFTLAWEFRDFITMGFIQSGTSYSEDLEGEYKVTNKTDTLLIFHEDSENPVARLSMSELYYSSMKSIIENNKFLILPRISSQAHFDAVCPITTEHIHVLCIIFVAEENSQSELYQKYFREFVAASQDYNRKNNLHFGYLYREKQPGFINAVAQGSRDKYNKKLNVVILQRIEETVIKYEWVPLVWESPSDASSSEALKLTVHNLLYENTAFSFETTLQKIVDETSQTIVRRIIKKLSNVPDFIKKNVLDSDLIPAGSIFASLVFIIGCGYAMSYLAKLEEKKINEARIKNNQDSKKTKVSQTPQVRVHELRGETYNGLVRLLKPGCRTIVLLCDNSTCNKLLPKFQKACFPYRKNKTLMFAFLNLSRHAALEWYKRILLLGLMEPIQLNINPKNAVGTVLALNGHRKYYCIYHTKHLEKYMRDRLLKEMQEQDESDSEVDLETGANNNNKLLTDESLLDYYSCVLFEDQLLNGFSNWLERLFDGSTQRYHINYWPDYPGK